LHGVATNPFPMLPLAARLRKRGYQVSNWKYPSFLGSIED